MADQSHEILTRLRSIELVQQELLDRGAEQSALLRRLLQGQHQMANNLDTLNTALDALNAATTQEAALLQADGAKLDAVQALITSIANTAGVPQSVIDKVTQAQTALSGVIATTTAQAARLDALAVDPTNPVPTPPPPAVPTTPPPV